MIKLYDGGVYLVNGTEVVPEAEAAKVETLTGKSPNKEEAKTGTIAYGILKEHNQADTMDQLRIKFDAMASHDITFVGIVQTAKASGMEKFPLPYVLTNCHNTLCAVGGTINEDDHMFGLSAAKKYGGIYVPPHIAVIHQYMREMHAGCGKMILGSDSHTRYGALGTMAIGEGGGELVKQLLEDTYDVAYPGVVAIYLDGKPQPFVGPQDIALAIIGAVFQNGFVKNKVMEFVGPGIKSMTTDFRNGVDVMTTETTCLSSIWETDEDTKAFLEEHGRGDDYQKLAPADVTYYDGCVYVDLSTVKPMIALPFHPSNTYEIDELKANPGDIFRAVEKEAEKVAGGRADFTLTDKLVDGNIVVQQGVIAGCAGGNYTNVVEAANALRGKSCGYGEFSLSVYPSSQPVNIELTRNGAIADLMAAGAIIRSAFCGPCFGAGDTPANNGLSIRHTTRNFPNREGSKPGNGQMAAVAGIPLRQRRVRETRLQRLQQGHRRGPRLRPEHQGLAGHVPAGGQHPAESLLEDHGPGHHDGRTHPVRRDLVLPLEPARPRRVHPLPQRPGVRRPLQGGGRPGESPRGRGRRPGERARTDGGLRDHQDHPRSGGFGHPGHRDRLHGLRGQARRRLRP